MGEANPTEANLMVEDHIKAHNTGNGVKKLITGANIKATIDNFTTLMETITKTIITVITEAHVDVTMEVIITDFAVTDGQLPRPLELSGPTVLHT